MDIYCPRCGEPWDVCSLVDDMTQTEASNLKAGNGCPCCAGKEIKSKPERAVLCGALMGIMGDDMDGLASTLDDFGI